MSTQTPMNDLKEEARRIRKAIFEIGWGPHDAIDPHDGSMERKLDELIIAELTRRTDVPKGHVKLDDGRVVKVLGTLPMTADGCVAGKGAKLYPLHPIDLGDGDDDFATLELAFYVVPPEGGRLDEDDEAQINTCYSTKEAALASEKGVGRE